MESEEALNYYIDEVKDTHNDLEVEECQPQNEVEQATDFLHKAGLADLTKFYQQGKEITENVVSDSISQRHLTEKQAQTVRSRVYTLNKTLHNRQPRRKQRQDIRDVTWNLETSSTGTRSRSATPDSLDSMCNLIEDLTSDEDQQLSSLPPFPLDATNPVFKTKIKWTYSEPLKRGDIAHLGSENVVLKRYQPIGEYGTITRPPRERSGSDPLEPLKDHNSEIFINDTTNLKSNISRSHTSIPVATVNNCSKVYISGCEKEPLSFEGLLKQNEQQFQAPIPLQEGVSIEELTDSEYQHLKPLLYVEVVAIFDQYKINFHKRKASLKNKGGNVFGVNLQTLVMRDMPRPTDNSMVPEVFQSILNQLNNRCIREDGILRIASQKQKFETLCSEIEAKFFNNRREVENLLKQATVHELTGVLKKLLRDLPDPVLTMELFDMFYKTSMISGLEDKIRALNLLVLMLPIEHRNTFRILLQFFLNIIEHEQYNRMNLHNVAMITAPSVFPPRLLLPKENSKFIKSLPKEELAKQINGAAVCCCIMETMLKTGENLWIVPGNLANQAKDAQRRARNRKDMSNSDKDKRIRAGKVKLMRSSTQYEPSAMNSPRIKRDIYV